MPVDPALAGRSYPPTPPYEVGREHVREFAAAIGDLNPAYRDPAAARALGHRDAIAPPTYAVVVTMRADAQVVADPEMGIDYRRVVHGDQRFTYVRPITVGDRLVVTTTVDAVRLVGGHAMVTTRGEVATEEGEPVCTAVSSLVVRGEDA